MLRAATLVKPDVRVSTEVMTSIKAIETGSSAS